MGKLVEGIKKLFNFRSHSTEEGIPVRGLTFVVRNPKTGRKEIRCSDGLHSKMDCPKIAETGNPESPTTIDEL